MTMNQCVYITPTLTPPSLRKAAGRDEMELLPPKRLPAGDGWARRNPDAELAMAAERPVGMPFMGAVVMVT